MGIVDNEALAIELGCKVGSSTYLEIPSGAHIKSTSAWDGTKERFKKELASWKRQCISKGVRITLIKSTLSGLHLYFMSILFTC